MKNGFIVFFCFVFSATICQNRENIEGIVVLSNSPLSDVHIINKNSHIGTVSNEAGVFKIPVKLNDSLFISHINYKEIYILITDKHLLTPRIKIELDENILVLNEMTLDNRKSIFHVDKDILIYEPKVTAKSLNLPYANTKKEENKSVLKIRSGAVVGLDNLINTLNGNKKRAKIITKLFKEDNQLAKIRSHFTDDFFVNNLKIKKDFINSFLEFCKNKHIIMDYNSKNQIEFMSLLISHSKKYLYKVENSYLTKN